ARRDLAHLYWLHRADAAAAIPILDDLAAKGDPVAQASRMLIAEARLDFRTARTWAQMLIESVAQQSVADISKGDEPAKQGHARRSREERRAVRRRRRAHIAAGTAIDRTLALGLAEIAAHVLDKHHGELADDDDNFIAFFERIDRSALPVEVTRPLLSQRAAIARRMRDPNYRDYYKAAGCVHAWTVGEVEGTHGELELRKHSGGPIRVDTDATLTQLSCVVRVWNPRPLAGSRRIATQLAVPGDRLRLEFSAQEAFRAYLDGVLIHRSDRNDRWPGRRVLLDIAVSPGPHQLEVHVALPRDKAWVLVRATDDQGRAIAASPADPSMSPVANPFSDEAGAKLVIFDGQGPGLDPQIYDPWRRVLAASDAIVDGDSDRAERWLGDLERYAPSFAEAQVMSARFEARDPSRDSTTSAARERQALEAALALDPSIEAARVRLLDLGLNRGEIAEVLKALQDRPKGTLDHISGDLLRFRAYLARGSESLAEAALAAAAKRNPRSCEVLRLQRQLAQSRGEVALEDSLVAASSHCSGMLSVRAGLAERRGDHRAALSFLEEALRRTPDDTDLLLGIATVAIAGQDYARARDAYKRVLSLNPYSTRARLGLADLSARRGDAKAARADLRASLEILPANSALHEIGTHVGIADDLEELRIDAAPLIAAYVRTVQNGSNDPYEGASEVLVLDRSAARIYADGSTRQLVHTVALLRTKEAIDRYGEMTIPEGAQLLTFQSVKPSGEIIEPELISGKAGLSLRGLEIGDFVEYEFLIDDGPHGYLPGHVDLSVFRFQSYNIPYHRSELVVMYPAEMPIKVES
ncbi:MAG TPA: tetratricopeptide repeat protein, partial [Nannocystis exedens]|nr:tetratricopeptide repeat protein [Nannocystis exedens]